MLLFRFIYRFSTDLYDAFNFHIVNFPHNVSNIPTKPAYGVFISQLFKYLRVCGNYRQFKTRSTNLTFRLLKQGFNYSRLQNTFRKFLQCNPIALHKYQVLESGTAAVSILSDCTTPPSHTHTHLCMTSYKIPFPAVHGC